MDQSDLQTSLKEMSKKGGHPKGKGPAKPTTTVVVDAAPLETFLISLFEQAEARVVKADQRANKETVKKLATALKAVAVDITSNPRSAGLHKHALRSVMTLSGAGYGSVAINRKIVSIFFAVLIDELRTNWKEYGFKETEVHPDYVRSPILTSYRL